MCSDANCQCLEEIKRMCDPDTEKDFIETVEAGVQIGRSNDG